jgi:CelD/BcsL family acetyltransferase involved in cellulose biosynthesis
MNYKLYNIFNSELEAEWIKFQNVNNSYVFQTYDWNRIWCEKFLDKSIPYIYIIYNDNSPIALFPFYLKRFFGARILYLIGGKQSDYLTPLFSNNYFEQNLNIESTWNYLNEIVVQYDYLCLDKVPFSLSLNQLNPIVKLDNFSDSNISYSAILPQTFDEYNLSLRAKLRSDILRQVRRLEEFGELSYCHQIDEFDFEKYLNILYEFKSMQYKRTGVIDAFAQKKVREFYIAFFQNKNSSFVPVLSVLRLNEEVIAIHLGVQFSGRFYYLLPAYNFDFQVYSPGKILLYRLIQEVINSRNVIFDFTVGGEEYKREWCNNELGLHKFESYRGFLGYFVKIVFSFIDHLKRDQHMRKLLTAIKRMN